MGETKRVAVVASGVTKWGPRPEATIRDLIAEAGKACFDSNKNITNKDIEGIVTSSAAAERTGPQVHSSPIAFEVLGITPSLYQHTACQCQSGAVNLRIIWSAIMAGLSISECVWDLKKYYSPLMTNATLMPVSQPTMTGNRDSA